MTVPVVLVHGWGGSFASTWESSGFTALLADAGRNVIGVSNTGWQLFTNATTVSITSTGMS